MEKQLRIAALGDLHASKTSESFTDLFKVISESADVLVISGDLTQTGLPEEARILAEGLKLISIPVLAVLGNHDVESGKEDEICAIFKEHGIIILDGESMVIRGVGFVGIKGFCGGFDKQILSSWGEKVVKDFVFETVNESLKLEKALSNLETERKVVIMHYSPIRKTVEGEHPEIITYLGSSRLSDPIDHYKARIVFHGHAHHGTHEGATQTGIPVFNVSLPVMKRLYPKKPFFVTKI